jgi:hypothetical protein
MPRFVLKNVTMPLDPEREASIVLSDNAGPRQCVQTISSAASLVHSFIALSDDESIIRAKPEREVVVGMRTRPLGHAL